MNANVVVDVHGRNPTEVGRKIELIGDIARAPLEGGPAEPVAPVQPPGPPAPPQLPAPYFDVGDAEGKPGDTVTLSVEGGCLHLATGFHIGGGCGKLNEPRSGYGLFEAASVKLGEFLRGYLRTQGLIVNDEAGNEVDQFWSLFQMFKYTPKPTPGRGNPLPEEWWEYAVGFFSMQQERLLSGIQIPNGTELFTLDVKILPDTKPGEYEVTCLDEHYYTTARARRRDFLYTSPTDGPPGGWTKIETFGGKITVT